jgi:hypothetical protein
MFYQICIKYKIDGLIILFKQDSRDIMTNILVCIPGERTWTVNSVDEIRIALAQVLQEKGKAAQIQFWNFEAQRCVPILTWREIRDAQHWHEQAWTEMLRMTA